jgi:superfamily II DNA or RNA helicase
MAQETITIIHNPVTAMVVEPSKATRLWFVANLSYEVAGSEHMGAKGDWNGRSSYFESRSGKFPTGFVRMLKIRLERDGHRVIVKCHDAPEPLGPVRPVVDDFKENPDYEYQYKVMERLIEMRGMIAQVATGGGKSRIFKLCAERIGRSTLFVTTRKSLMYQMGKDYEFSMKKPVGYMGDGMWSPKKGGVNFAIIDTLSSRLETQSIDNETKKLVAKKIQDREDLIQQVMVKAGLPKDLSMWRKPPPDIASKVDKIREAMIDKYPVTTAGCRKEVTDSGKVQAHMERRKELMAFLADVDFVCLEEAHEVSSNSYYAVMKACKNAHYRLALTATPFMKDDESANMRLMATTGTVGIKITEKMLIEKGILAKPYFLYEKLPLAPGVFPTSKWVAAQAKGIVSNEFRNKRIVSHCLDAKKYKLSTLVLVTQTKHGNTLKKMLTESGLRVLFISGKDNQNIRQSALDKLGAGKIDVLIGSTIMDVGVDCPSIGLIVLAGGGKAEVSLRQRIGRGLRAKKTGPNVAYVVDFQDGYNSHLTKHYKMRRKVVEDTPGFGENIVSHFPYESHGFAA